MTVHESKRRAGRKFIMAKQVQYEASVAAAVKFLI